MKTTIISILSFLTLLLLLCSSLNGKTGKLVGIKASTSLGALHGKMNKIEYAGVVIIQLGDGTKIDAFCPKSLADSLKGGQQLKIRKLDSANWIVYGIVKDKK